MVLSNLLNYLKMLIILYLTNKNNEQEDELIDNLFNGNTPNGPINVNDIFQAMFSNKNFSDIINESYE